MSTLSVSPLAGPAQHAARAGRAAYGHGDPEAAALLLRPQRGPAWPCAAQPALPADQGRYPQRETSRHRGPRSVDIYFANTR